MKTRDYENMGIYGYVKLYIFQPITNLLTYIYSQILTLYAKKGPKKAQNFYCPFCSFKLVVTTAFHTKSLLKHILIRLPDKFTGSGFLA